MYWWERVLGGTQVNVATCKNCGRLFNVISNKKICPNCIAALEDRFQDVKKYLDENPSATIEILSKECDISVKQIKEWIREERLTFKEGSGCGITCEKCGTMILTGKYCDQCKMKIHNNLSSAIDKKIPMEPKKKDRDRDRMRFLQNL